MRRALAVGALAALLVAGGGCTGEDRGFRDAPIDRGLQDNSAPFIVNMPDLFMNLALKCVGATLIVAHTREGAPVLVENASICAEGKAEQIGVPRVGEP